MRVKCEFRSTCGNPDCRHIEEHEFTPDCQLHCDTIKMKSSCKKENEDVI